MKSFKMSLGYFLGVVVCLVLVTATQARAGNTSPAPKAKPDSRKEAKASPDKAKPKAAAPRVKAPAPKKPGPRKAAPRKPAPKPKTQAKPKPAPKPRMIKIRAKDIYLGRYKGFRKACVLDTQKVFNAISYYQQIKSAGLEKKSGRYWILMEKSNRIFNKALRQLSRTRGYDLIGARDSILIDGDNPSDLTEVLIQLIPSISLY